MKLEITAAALTHYVETGGNACPACGSELIEGGSVEIDDYYAVVATIGEIKP